MQSIRGPEAKNNQRDQSHLSHFDLGDHKHDPTGFYNAARKGEQSRRVFPLRIKMKTFKRTLSERKEKLRRLSAQHKKAPAPSPSPSPSPSFPLVCRPLSSSAHNLATHPPSSPPLPAFRCWRGAHTHTQNTRAQHTQAQGKRGPRTSTSL